MFLKKKMKNFIAIDNRKIGESFPVFIIAELSANHFQKYDTALKLIKEAKKAGADAVKLQTYTPDTLTIDVDNKYFRVNHPKWGGQTFYELYKKGYTPWKWFKKLKKITNDLGMIFFSTAFDKTAVDFLEELEIPVHKISSFELVDLPLIEYVAKTRKPIILSTGMATVAEIYEAVNTARKYGAKDIILLKCVSNYPAMPEDMNLRTIPHMKELFNCFVGISDHTLGIGVSIAAISMGANVIEKHFTISRKIETPDSFFSMEPKELKDLVENVRIVEKALGKIHYGLTKEERKSKISRRSLFVIEDMREGDVFTESNVKSIRPAYGYPPKYLENILGKRAKINIKRGTPLNLNLIS